MQQIIVWSLCVIRVAMRNTVTDNWPLQDIYLVSKRLCARVFICGKGSCMYVCVTAHVITPSRKQGALLGS